MIAGDEGAVAVYDADMAGEPVLRLSLGPLPRGPSVGDAVAAGAVASPRGGASVASAARASGGSSSSDAAAGGSLAVMPRWDQGACVTALAAVEAAVAANGADADADANAAAAAAAAAAAPPPRHSLCLAGDAAGRLIAWDLTAGGALVAAVVAHRRVAVTAAAGSAAAAAGLPPLPPGGQQPQLQQQQQQQQQRALRPAPVAVVSAASEQGGAAALVLTASAADPRARVWRLPALTLAAELPHAEAEWQDFQQMQQQQQQTTPAAAAARVSGGLSGGAGVLSAALSPDGAVAVTTGSGDRAAVVWDVAAAAASAGPDLLSQPQPPLQQQLTQAQVQQQQQQRRPKPRVLRGHEGWVVSAAFAPAPLSLTASSSSSPLSSWLVLTASHDGTARVWSADTGACLRILRGHDGRLGGISVAPCSTSSSSSFSLRAVTAGDDATARVWDVSSGACLAILGPEAHRGWVSVCGVDASGAVAVTADGAGSVAVWDIPPQPPPPAATAADDSPPPLPAEPRPIALFAGAHAREVTGLSLTRRGGFAVTCGADGSARLFDLRAARAAAAALAAGGATPRCSGASASSEAQAAAAAMVAASVGAHEGRVRVAVAASAAASAAAGGGVAVTCGDDGALRAWDACGTGECLAAAPNAHGCAVQWLFAPSSLSPSSSFPQQTPAARVVSASGDRRVAAWDFWEPSEGASASPRLLLEPRGPPRALLPAALGSRTKAVAVSGDGGVALVTLFDSSVTAYRLDGGGVGGNGNALLASRPSDVSAAGGSASARSSTDEAGGAPLPPHVLARVIRRGERGGEGAHSGGVNSVALSRCGRAAVTASKDATARVWALPPLHQEGDGDDDGRARCTAVLRGHSDGVTCVLLLEEEEEEQEEEGSATASSPPHLVATGSLDGDVRVWDRRTGDCLAVLSPPLSVAEAPAASPPATGSADSGDEKEEPSAPPGVRALGWDGRSLLFSLDDAEPPRSRARLWSLLKASQQQQQASAAVLRPRLVASLVHSGGVPVHAAAFGGGGGGPRCRRPLLATGGADCSVILWHAATGAPLAFFVADAPITALAFSSLSTAGATITTVVAGDAAGRVHCVAVPPLALSEDEQQQQQQHQHQQHQQQAEEEQEARAA